MTRSRRARPAPESLPDLVPHPRYGGAVIASGFDVPEAVVRGSFWQYRRETLYAESAIPADLARQNFSTMARLYYVDLLRRCRDCGRPFIFFAREQQHWYETLGFYVDADCVRCPACRRVEHERSARDRRFAKALTRAELTDGELATLADDARALWEQGVLRNEERLRRALNRARRRIPDHAATRALARLVASLRAPRD